ncbi:LINE-1 reverse transcriptase isogeny [Gossypium australe]|uniref:LINE-1 reverse transcriptase isogeny n=1 Tax=Gossypium australe TaxID=47621 RepID=A0A5B6VB18_9ROSI|nr:LINE-1 reverse transcriptase isogeny [Gossypium australe]
MMTRMGFAKAWVDSVIECVSTTLYSGLKQGDSLSPFLFLICSEGLSTLMRLAGSERKLKGVRASRSGPSILNLLFVDDCILFGEATTRGVIALKSILKEYEDCSGNVANTTENSRMQLSNELGVRYSNNPENYLGLPNVIGRKKKASFQSLKD